MSDNLPERLDLAALNRAHDAPAHDAHAHNAPADDAPAESGLSWTMGSFLFEEAFGKLASALRWMFWGLVLQLVALTTLFVILTFVLRLEAPPAAILALSPVMMLAGIGSLVLVWGEQRCLHLTLPLDMTRSIPGHGWLRAAYWCELAAILLRFVRNIPLPLKPRTIALPLEILSMFFLLFFLRRIAIAIDRTDLRRMIHAIFALAAVAAGLLAAAAIAVALRRQITPLPGISLGGLALLVSASVPVMFAVLLWRMGTAVRVFGEFLATVAAEEAADLAYADSQAAPETDLAGPQPA
jgi:hypothetical protein